MKRLCTAPFGLLLLACLLSGCAGADNTLSISVAAILWLGMASKGQAVRAGV
jgi:hypothetical protein